MFVKDLKNWSSFFGFIIKYKNIWVFYRKIVYYELDIIIWNLGIGLI